MGYISRLPKSLIGHLRSSSILSDLAQAVEELICNSLDAGAKKVCAYVDLASFYIKVEDDGSGITRDDLILIGERHATSKLHDLVDLESGVTTLGFRGEALSSLSDIAILEVITRVRGSPNTYKKILKGCKKLSMGLSSEQRAPGTTVVLRELFHNLPVRRKVIHSSPRKVLQGVKDRTMRLALIHPDVSFSIIDLERQENLVHTKPCISPLDTLCEFFGEQLRHELCELHHAKKSLKVYGFVSKETSRLSSKAIQFFYLNGRFVHKTPVHKLINTLFSGGNGGFSELGNPSEGWMPSAPSKQVLPAFLLDLSCPLSYYDITFEATKTLVEFKDWSSILLFVTEALGTVWSKSSKNLDGGATKHLTEKGVGDFKKSSPRKQKPWQHVDPTYHPRGNANVAKQEDDLCCKRGRLQSTDFNGGSGNMAEELLFNTPKRPRAARKRREYGSIPEEQIHDESFTVSWSLQQCSRDKGTSHFRGHKKQCNFQQKGDFWHEEDDLQRACSIESANSDLHSDLFEGILKSKKMDGILDLLHHVKPPLTFCGTSTTDTKNSPLHLNVLGSHARSGDLSLDSQADQPASAHCTREQNGHLVDFDREDSAVMECVQTPSPFRRAVSVCSPRVRRCLYDFDLKSCYTDDFLCHSERQTVSNFNIKSGADMESIWTPKSSPLTITFPANSSYGGLKRELRAHSFRNDVLSLKSSHSLLESEPVICSQSKDMEILDSLLTPSTQIIKNNVSPDKGGIAFTVQLDEQTAVKESLEEPSKAFLRRTLSGPPFYRLPRKHAVSIGLPTSSCCRESHSGNEMQKDCQKRVYKEGWLASYGKGRHHDLPAAASGCNLAVDKRALQEDAMPRCKDSDGILPVDRNDLFSGASKWRNSDCLDLLTDDSLVDVTAIQLYKDWKNPCMRNNEPNVLDLSSGILGPSNKHLLPESISKEDFQTARVLQQMEKKFIATVAESILVVIDQHAADERVRLEQFRKEVLEEKRHLSTLLDYPQELSISMGDQQLLHTYQSQIEDWGWRFKVFSGGKNYDGRRHGQAHHGNTAALLTGVPNILGESLTDTKYLSEYLHQLATTDGTSAPPPAVLRVMASKACRGAIMFGDFLLSSECQQLVEGLKRTALSFQCAHGRPTLVPIVNLKALHLRLGRLQSKKRHASENVGEIVSVEKPDTAGLDCRNTWHGLQWHRPTLERARERVTQAEEM